MEAHDIPDEIKKYINTQTYYCLKSEEREIYLKSAKKLMRKLDNLADSLDKLKIHDKYRRLNYRYIKFVGMRFYKNHTFTTDNRVRLEQDDTFFRPNSIKVMLYKRNKWRHVAYVERGDARWLNAIGNYEELPLNFAEMRPGVAKYRVDLKLLEDAGVRIKTKMF
jgi:hypothetical protein